VLKRLWFQRLKLEYDEPLTSFACNINLRRCTEERSFMEQKLPVWSEWVAPSVGLKVGERSVVSFSAPLEVASGAAAVMSAVGARALQLFLHLQLNLSHRFPGSI